MGKEVITFGDTEKGKFHNHKNLIGRCRYQKNIGV